VAAAAAGGCQGAGLRSRSAAVHNPAWDRMQQQRVQQWDWAAMLGSSKVSSCRVRQQQAQLQVRAAKLVTAQARRHALAAHGVREFQSRSSDIVLSEGSAATCCCSESAARACQLLLVCCAGSQVSRLQSQLGQAWPQRLVRCCPLFSQTENHLNHRTSCFGRESPQ
jgi:hypothetical protein